jgi:hypothetical protein
MFANGQEQTDGGSSPDCLFQSEDCANGKEENAKARFGVFWRIKAMDKSDKIFVAVIAGVLVAP